MPELVRGKKKSKVGVVVSNRMAKTIVVRVERLSRHPLYGRVMRKFNSFKAHDDKNEAKTGDRVLIAETRPFSKDKRWRLVKIVEKAKETQEA
ncbi:MAG: 30S ribosomal protein S17 [Candidatus Omnitrophica bacterium]|nr:30S ribosomal protein S17 [Candidatus Omnitrophota bacterium]